MWLTELGWSTCRANAECTTEAQQAANLTSTIQAMRTTYAGFIEAVFFYHHNDLGSNQTDKEHFFGLKRLDGSAKPAWEALKAATAVTAV